MRVVISDLISVSSTEARSVNTEEMSDAGNGVGREVSMCWNTPVSIKIKC